MYALTVLELEFEGNLCSPPPCVSAGLQIKASASANVHHVFYLQVVSKDNLICLHREQ